MKTTALLVILDGWGISPATDYNGIALAKTPNYDRILTTYPWTTLQASEQYVGLPKGQMGNSEVGHLNIGAGRLVQQLLPRINNALADPNFLNNNPALSNVLSQLKGTSRRLHVFGLLSPGGIHSHQDHIESIYDALTAAGITVVMHAFTDGRDTPPSSAVGYVNRFLAGGKRQIHTVGGRFFGMDRDKRWDRVQTAFETIVHGNGEHYNDIVDYINASYGQGVTDEFIRPAHHQGYDGIKDGDAILMVNFRSDRVRQLLLSMLDPEFSGFKRGDVPKLSAAVGMVSYSDQLDTWMTNCFPAEALVNTLGEYASLKGLTQLRVAETEKYAHVTFFLNGGREEPFAGEDRVLIPSPKVATYDLQPSMAAEQVTEAVLKGIGVYDLIIVNYANPDMVGHTGVVDASIQAAEVIDAQLEILESAILNNGGTMIISADHGNIETLWDADTQQPHTAHTMNPVPFIIINKEQTLKLNPGALCDIAPTVLRVLQQEQPAEMTGKCLIE